MATFLKPINGTGWPINLDNCLQIAKGETENKYNIEFYMNCITPNEELITYYWSYTSKVLRDKEYDNMLSHLFKLSY